MRYARSDVIDHQGRGRCRFSPFGPEAGLSLGSRLAWCSTRRMAFSRAVWPSLASAWWPFESQRVGRRLPVVRAWRPGLWLGLLPARRAARVAILLGTGEFVQVRPACRASGQRLVERGSGAGRTREVLTYDVQVADGAVDELKGLSYFACVHRPR
jgi:hypothetical protein